MNKPMSTYPTIAESLFFIMSKLTRESVAYLIILNKSSNSLAKRISREAATVVIPALAELLLNIREGVLFPKPPPGFIEEQKTIDKIIEKKYGEKVKLGAIYKLIQTGCLNTILTRSLDRLLGDVRR